MSILTLFAESVTVSTNSSASDTASILALLTFLLILTIFSIGLYLAIALSLMSIFKKAGVKPWIAWIPFYNSWKLLEIGGQQGYWAILTIVPVVSIVSAIFIYIAMYHIGKKLGKDDTFVILGIFLPIVWYIWLAVDKSEWHDEASSAPSLA